MGSMPMDSAVEFSLWRRELAYAAGIVAEKETLYTSKDKIDWAYFAKKTDFYGYWNEHPGDPIWFILALNDQSNSSIISHTYAKELSKRLKGMILDLPGNESYPNWQTRTKKFITTLNKAAKAKEDITFS